MATQTSYGSGATDVSATWSAATLANAYDSSATTYAVTTNVTATHILDVTGYGFAALVPSNATLTSVVVNVSQYVGNGARWSNPTVQAYVGTTAIGSAITLTERAAAGNEDVTLTGLTLADVRDANFKIRFSATRTSATGSTLCNFGWANVTVTYTEPAAQLVVQDATHSQSADSPVLTYHDPSAQLVVQDSTHSQSVDPIDLTQHNAIVVQDSTHAQSADNIALTVAGTLTVSDGLHSHSADNVVLIFEDVRAKIWNGTSWVTATGGGAASPTFISAESDFTTVSQTTITVPKPAAAQVGDIVLVQVISSSASAVITSPADFTNIVGHTTNVDYSYVVAYRVIQSGDPASWDWSIAATAYTTYATVTLRGQSATPIHDFDNVNVSGTVLNTSVTTTTPCTLVSFAGVDLSTAYAWSIDSGTERIDETLGTEWLSHAVYTEEVGTGTFNRTITGNQIQDINATTVAVAGGGSGVEIWNGTSWRTDAKVWNGTKWVLL